MQSILNQILDDVKPLGLFIPCRIECEPTRPRPAAAGGESRNRTRESKTHRKRWIFMCPSRLLHPAGKGVLYIRVVQSREGPEDKNQLLVGLGQQNRRIYPGITEFLSNRIFFQDSNNPIRAIHLDQLPILQFTGGVIQPGDAWDAVFTRHDCAML